MRRLVATLAVGLLAALPAAHPAHAAPTTEPQSLNAAVTAKLLERAERLPAFAHADADDTKVSVTRRGGRTWAFGSAVLLAPRVEDAFPDGWLFLARRGGDGWRVAFDGESAFATLSATAPLVNAKERTLFAAHGGQFSAQANGDWRTGMRLPYAVGQSWGYRGGPHAWDAGSGPWSSLDLAGGDQVVRAPRGGTAYTMCRGWIRVVHDRGYSTDHYHLWDNINVNGAGVGAGAYLGYTGTDITCGGAASGRHVHWALRQNGAYVGMAYHIMGKWVPMNGGAQYGGYALHGSTRVNVGGSLYNYGALGFNQGIMDTNGGGTVNKRSGPGTNYPVVGSVGDGVTVTISCSRNGTTHSGRWGATSLWNRLSDGTWVSDAFMYTGLNGPANGWC
ncbi:MAG: peptidase M23 [Micromonosporaceae bacterium]|nr:peptidase M23 [Micromonosporaceae bacterium]